MLYRTAEVLKIRPPDPTLNGFLSASGDTVPVITTSGFATGCVFSHTDGTTGTAFYINEGTVASCDFVAVAGLTVAQEALLSATAGTAAASKAVILDASKGVTGLGAVSVAGVLTLAAQPVLTTLVTAEAKTLTMTNAPAAADAGKATPVYISVKIGAINYVMPAWPLA